MLLIDIGNSRIKWAAWQNNQMVGYSSMAYSEDNLQEGLIKNLSGISRTGFDQQRVCVCSVASESINQLVFRWFETHWQISAEFIETQNRQCGVVNAYHKTSDLGVDRWLGMLAAYQRHKKAVCIIDCGTAVTFDVVNETGQHLGGLIMPGLQMMQQALLIGTQRIDSIQGQVSSLADNTQDAVIGGCTHLLVSGLDGLYRKYSKQFDGELMCVMTGGDGEKLSNAMESNCHYEEDLILYGLYLAARSGD